LFNNSYGQLAIKKDMNLLKAMAMSSAEILAGKTILNKEERGFEYSYKVEQEDKVLEEYDYKVYFDSENTFNLAYTFTDESETESQFYVTENNLYKNIDGSRKRKPLTEDEISSYKKGILNDINEMHELAFSKIESFDENKISTSLDFSFSPFYLLGIKVKLVEDTTHSTILHYDLNGILRKAEYKEEKKVTTFTYSYNDSKIDFPDFKFYGLEHKIQTNILTT